MTYDQALKEYQEAKQKLDEAEKLIMSAKDGYKYAIQINSWGSTWMDHFNNEFAANKLYCRYNGDNGYSRVFTINPNHNFYNGDGHAIVLSQEEWLAKFDVD